MPRHRKCSQNSKVSVVIPCYNNKKYIIRQFNSILTQEWDNIELILVNDGSDDGTRDVIAEYVAHFIERDFEIVIIEQNNQGIACAVRNGFMRATGDYICQLDQDDEIAPDYVSLMAGFLDGNSDYDACVSDFYWINVREDNEDLIYCNYFGDGCTDSKLLERSLLNVMRHEVWVWMVRKLYFDRCKIVENFCCIREGTQESSYFIPLLAYNGNIKHIQKPLYKYYFGYGQNFGDARKEADKCLVYYSTIIKQLEYAIRSITIFDEARKLYLIGLGTLREYTYILEKEVMWRGAADKCHEISQKIKSIIKELFSVDLKDEITRDNVHILLGAIQRRILKTEPSVQMRKDYVRKIGYGAKGYMAKTLLPMFINTQFEPTELWDIAGDGTEIKKPDFKSLTGDDLVIIFPNDLELDFGEATVFKASEMLSFILFPELH